MKTNDDITLVSPCGGYCGDCAAYKVKDDPSWGNWAVAFKQQITKE